MEPVPDFFRDEIISAMRRKQMTLEEARNHYVRLLGQMPGSEQQIDRTVAVLRDEQQKLMLLESPPLARSQSYFSRTHLESEARLDAWYTGPAEGDKYWEQLAARMESGSLAEVFDEVDAASTKVVAHLANPGVRGLRKKGLVVGHVQSGKTANYAAVSAKATDAGYRMTIVLSGMHNNLRKQTQQRLTNDVTDESWFALTDEENDFSGAHQGSSLLLSRTPSLAVVKKNMHRLRWLRDFLREIKMETRRGCPILLIDDEADQATPNTGKVDDEPSRINQLIREIWAEVPTGSYVGYTATPFANVFIDPDDDTELYPSDFILALSPGDGYFGAEKVFGRFNPDDAESGDDGLDMVRSVPEADAEILQPPSDKESRGVFDPDLPHSLEEAVRWFCLSVAVRALRGQGHRHTSMLVHTTHYVQPHFATQAKIQDFLGELLDESASGSQTKFRAVWDNEVDRTGVGEDFNTVWSRMDDVLPSIVVVADNGASDDRLDYDVYDENGDLVPQYVIAVGGGTLSRGLTLEGLVVSYFIRTSTTYDTLLQMGRWFGYRFGYEDLARVWMPDDLRDEFRFLAQVEHELREEIEILVRSGLSPQQMGLRIRSHPGRLEITAASKMQHAQLVRMSYSGQTMQTIQFHERNRNVLSSNRQALEALVKVAREDSQWTHTDRGDHWIARDVRATEVRSFLKSYQGHEGQENWRPDLMSGWIDGPGADTLWNVVVFNPQNEAPTDIDIGLDEPVRPVSRAPLNQSMDRANIKALMSLKDRLLDLQDVPETEVSKADDKATRSLRARYADQHGLLVLYLIDPRSEPTAQSINSRRTMDAPEPLVGVGLVFPTINDWEHVDPKQYFSVRPDWHMTEGEIEEIPDHEGSRKPAFISGAA